jgi:NADPH-dependent 2,4-dienoyl-CoA reductase/sulfur reductase-like enzyme
MGTFAPPALTEYAVGDAVDLPGPKMGHMAVLRRVAAANIASRLLAAVRLHMITN